MRHEHQMNEASLGDAEGICPLTTECVETGATVGSHDLRWESAFNAISAAICLLDCEGRIQRCNKTMQELLGRPASQILGNHCWELVHGTSEPIEDCPVARMRETLQRETSTIQLGERWFEISADPVFDERGSLIGAAHIAEDITEARRLQDELQQRTDDFALISSVSTAVCHGRSLQQILQMCSRLTAKVFSAHVVTVYLLSAGEGQAVSHDLGVGSGAPDETAELASPQRPSLRIPLEPWSLYRKIMQVGEVRLITDPATIERLSAETVDVDARSEKPPQTDSQKLTSEVDGTPSTQAVVLAPMVTPMGCVGLMELRGGSSLAKTSRSRIGAVATELTTVIQRVGAESARTESERYHRALMNQFDENIVVIDRDYRVTDVNDTFLASTGLQRSEAIAQYCYELTHGRGDPCDSYGEVCPLRDAFSTGAPVTCRHQHKAEGGSQGWFDIRMSPLRDAKGNITHVIESARNVTAMVAMQKVLERRTHDLNERVKELNCLYSLAQLLRNPNTTWREKLHAAVELTVNGHQYPEATCARIRLDGQEVQTAGFRETAWKEECGIVADGARVGAVEVYYLGQSPEGDDGPFLKEESAMICAIAEQFGRHLEHTRAESALRGSEERLRQVFASSPDAIAVTDMSGVITECNSTALELFKCSTRDEIIGRRALDFIAPQDRCRIEQDLKDLSEQNTARNVECEHITADGSTFPGDFSASALRTASGEVIGFVGITQDISDRRKVEAVLRRKVELEETVARVSSSLAATTPEETAQAAHDALEAVGRFLRVDHAYVCSISDDGLSVDRSYSWRADTAEPGTGELEELPWHTFSWGSDQLTQLKQVVIPRVDELPPEAAAEKEELLARGVRSLIGIPAMANGRLTGFAGASMYSSPREWDAESVILLRALCEMILGAADRYEAHEALKESLARTRAAVYGTVKALSALAERRDPYTAGHQQRVARLAYAIGEELGLPETDLEGIRVAGLLHDIGKIRVPAEILSKPGTLDKSEFSIIKTHPSVGHEILHSVEFPWPVREMVLQHHERLDGSGYPAGLSGDEILLQARILGVADVMEAMASHRPYRPAHTMDMATDEISRNRGILYDPAVVDACLKLFREQRFSFDEPDDEAAGQAA